MAIGPDLHTRLVDTIEICYRETGEVIFQSAASGEQTPLQRKVPVQDLPAGIQRARADPVQLQFAVRRLPALPGIRQHDRFRHGPRDPRQDALARRRRGGSVDQAEVPLLAGQLPEIGGQEGAVRRCLLRPERQTSATLSTISSAVSSTTWKPRNTSCTCACSSAAIAATRSVPDCKGARLRKEALYVTGGRQEPGRCGAHEYRGGLRLLRRSEAEPGGERDRGQDPGGDPAAPEVPQRCGARLPDARPACRQRFPAAKRSAFNSPRVWARAWWARATCSTSHPSGCTAAIPGG